MKKSRRIWWLLAGILIFASIILWAGDAMFGEDGGKGLGVAYFCFGGGLFIGFFLIIEWIVEFQKSSSFEKSEKKATERKGLCKQGRDYLQRKDQARTEEEKRNWNFKWGIHRGRCPTCGRIKLV